VALRILIDEHLRGLHRAILRHNLLGGMPVDAVCVGDFPDLPFGSLDATILEWADAAGRILVTLDRDTIPRHLNEHLQQGKHSPGVLILNGDRAWSEMVEYLVLVAHAGRSDEFENAARFGP
jgi:hypothetical protein